MTSEKQANTDTRPGAGDIPKPIWLFALGAVMICLGILALSFPLVSTLAVELTIGILLAIAGIATLVHAFWDKDWTGFIWQILIGAVYLFGAAVFFLDPLGVIVALTIYLGVVFFVDGVFLIVMGVRARPTPRWGWFVLSGIASILLSLYVFFGTPTGASLALLGVLLGVNFIFVGATLLAFGFGIRDVMKSETS